MFKPPTDTGNILIFFGNSILLFIFAVNQYFLIMRTRKVSVYVFSYPEKNKIPLYPFFFDDFDEVLEQSDKLLTDKSLEDVLQSYVDKTELFASFDDKVQWYRIVVRDTEGRLVKIFKA